MSKDLKKGTREESKHLLANYSSDRHRKIPFTDENIFSVEETLSKENDRVYARTSKQAELVPRVQRDHNPDFEIVW